MAPIVFWPLLGCMIATGVFMVVEGVRCRFSVIPGLVVFSGVAVGLAARAMGNTIGGSLAQTLTGLIWAYGVFLSSRSWRQGTPPPGHYRRVRPDGSIYGEPRSDAGGEPDGHRAPV